LGIGGIERRIVKMDLKTLESIMICEGVSIRAIPFKTVGVFETRHIDKYPNGIIYYDEIGKRDMLRVERIVSKTIAGKFIVEKKCGTGALIRFSPKKYYDTIEEAINDLCEIKTA
jgi:hypothetical protein